MLPRSLLYALLICINFEQLFLIPVPNSTLSDIQNFLDDNLIRENNTSDTLGNEEEADLAGNKTIEDFAKTFPKDDELEEEDEEGVEEREEGAGDGDEDTEGEEPETTTTEVVVETTTAFEEEYDIEYELSENETLIDTVEEEHTVPPTTETIVTTVFDVDEDYSEYSIEMDPEKDPDWDENAADDEDEDDQGEEWPPRYEHKNDEGEGGADEGDSDEL